MGIKLKDNKKKKTNKKIEKKVQLEMSELNIDKSLEEITRFEISAFLSRLKFMSEKHNLMPVVEAFKIRYDLIKK